MSIVFVLRILRVTEFSKVRKLSAERKIMKILSQGKFKYNITNLSGLYDFNDDFLYIEGEFDENVSVVNAWKVMAVCEGCFYHVYI